MSPAVISPPRNRSASRMNRRCSCASAANTASRSSRRRSASVAGGALDRDLLNGGELHVGAAGPHGFPHRRDLRQGVRAPRGLRIGPREDLDVEDPVLVGAAEDQVRRVILDQAELGERRPVGREELLELRLLLGADPVAAEGDVVRGALVGAHAAIISLFANYLSSTTNALGSR